MMQTPLGPLNSLDLTDHNVCAEILAEDKHQLIEGLVFESFFDQYLLSLTAASGEQVQLVDVDTAVVRLPEGGGAAFVWARSRGQGLGRYLEALSSRMKVWLVEYSGSEFLAAKFHDGQLRSERSPLQEVARIVSKRDAPRFGSIEANVRNRIRINQSFWGYLSERHGTHLGFNVVLPRIFLNWGVQPWFRQLWNVDRVFLYGDQLWHFEIKHKYPMSRNGQLLFGINDGELRLMRHLVECGLRSMHTLIVKPYWDKTVGSMYLLNEMEARFRAAVIGREMTSDEISAVLMGAGSRSGADTTFIGQGSVNFRSFPATSFRRFGLLSDDHQQIAARIFSQMAAGDQPQCGDHDLERLRLQR